MAAQRFRWGRAMNDTTHPVVDGERTPGKVAIYATCYVNYNEPGIGHDLVKCWNTTASPTRSSRRSNAAACPSSSSAT
jgi:glycerol-3-phosphate dehydrogenase subunit C